MGDFIHFDPNLRVISKVGNLLYAFYRNPTEQGSLRWKIQRDSKGIRDLTHQFILLKKSPYAAKCLSFETLPERSLVRILREAD